MYMTDTNRTANGDSPLKSSFNRTTPGHLRQLPPRSDFVPPRTLDNGGSNSVSSNSNSSVTVTAPEDAHSKILSSSTTAYDDPVNRGLPIRAQSVENFTSAASRRLTTTPKRTITVRALFDYDPRMETGLPTRGLAFQYGDILEVVNASDHEWWQARRLVLYAAAAQATPPPTTLPPPQSHFSSPDQPMATARAATTTTTTSPSVHSMMNSPSYSTSLVTRTPLGIVPSPERIERRHRVRARHVNFFNKVQLIGTNATNQSQQQQQAPSSSPGGPASGLGLGSLQTPSAMGWDSGSSGGNNSNSTSGGAHGTNRMFPVSMTNGREGVEGGAFDEKSDIAEKKAQSGSLTRLFLRRFSHRRRRKPPGLPRAGLQGSMDEVAEADCDMIRTYEAVVPISINLSRPLLIFGPMKERVVDLLLQDSRFSTCVPHTSRPSRAGEQDGRDYHFVRTKAQMEEELKSDRFIGVGQFQDHYYATSVDSVRHTLRTGRVCVLDVGLPAVRRLELDGLYPIAILLKPNSVSALRSIQRRLTEEQAKRSIDLASRLEFDNWRLFSTILTYNTIEGAVNAVKQFVNLHAGPLIWVPADTVARTAGADSSNSPLGSQSSTLPRTMLPSQIRATRGLV